MIVYGIAPFPIWLPSCCHDNEHFSHKQTRYGVYSQTVRYLSNLPTNIHRISFQRARPCLFALGSRQSHASLAAGLRHCSPEGVNIIRVGETARDIFTSWNSSGADSKKIDIIYQKFSEHLSPKKNKLFYRYIFHERKQRPGESFETFVTDLRNLVKDCEYDNPHEMVRDRIVSGITSQKSMKSY